MQTGKDGPFNVDGAEDRIIASSMKKKLIWVHTCNRLKNQKGITEFWNTVAALHVVDVEVGLDLELDAGLETGSVGQLPPDLPNQGQIRVAREKDRKQSFLEQYFIRGNLCTVTTRKASDAATVSAIGLGPSSTHSKKRTTSG